MADVPPRHNRFARFVESAKSPALLLLVPIVLIYGRTVSFDFMLDDYRHLRVMEEFREGRRDSLQLFRFLTSDETNAALRRDGTQPWWLGDDVRYQHWRPFAEWTLYGQFLIFGRNPIGYRIVTLLGYWFGAWLIYLFFRRLSDNERAARWGGLVFTTLACHAIPVVFVSAQADVIAFVLCAGLLVGALRWAQSGSMPFIFLSILLFAVSLGFKESALPIAVAPGAIGLIAHRGPPRRRLVGLSCLLICVGAAWFVAYSRGGFGSNTIYMLNPVSRPIEYLAALPGRVVLLLSSLAIPVNPFIFYFRPRGESLLYAFGAVGILALLWIARAIHRRATAIPAARAMVFFIVLFMPLLVCTVPDDRILMLPSIGFAFLVGLWIAGRRETNESDARLAPIAIFLIVHAAFAFGATEIMRYVAARIHENYHMLARDAELLQPGDTVFILDSTLDPQVLFAHDVFHAVTGRDAVTLRYLSDSESLQIARTGPNTLELSDADDGLLTSFFGGMAESRAHPKREGDEFDAGEVKGRITRIDGGVVRTVELTFQRPLDDPSYHFYRCEKLGELKPWSVPSPVR